MGIREQLQKAAGLFIEVSPKREEALPPAEALESALEQAPPVKTVEHLVREAPGPDLADVTVPPTAAPVPVTEGKLDFLSLYQQAGLPPTPFTAEQMLDMLATLPAELSLDAKRQTVKATLGAIGKSIGATPETIITDASRKLAALTAYADHLSRQTEQLIAQEEQTIADLQAQIAEKKQLIDATRQHQTRVAGLCHTEADRLDDVLEFFSLDVPPSKYAGGQPAGKR